MGGLVGEGLVPLWFIVARCWRGESVASDNDRVVRVTQVGHTTVEGVAQQVAAVVVATPAVVAANPADRCTAKGVRQMSNAARLAVAHHRLAVADVANVLDVAHRVAVTKTDVGTHVVVAEADAHGSVGGGGDGDQKGDGDETHSLSLLCLIVAAGRKGESDRHPLGA